MKIDGPGSAGKIGAAKKTSKSGGAKGTGFSDALHGASEEPAEETGGVAGGAALGSIDALLALQGVDAVDSVDPDEKRRNSAAVDRGEDLLDRLEDIRIGLLTGRIPQERLQQLKEAVRRSGESAADPTLRLLINEIEIRVEVELAKHAG